MNKHNERGNIKLSSFFFSTKHMLWVRKISVSEEDCSFEYPQYM